MVGRGMVVVSAQPPDLGPVRPLRIPPHRDAEGPVFVWKHFPDGCCML